MVVRTAMLAKQITCLAKEVKYEKILLISRVLLR